MKRDHERLLRKSVPGVPDSVPKTPEELDALRVQCGAALKEGDANAALAPYAVLRAEPGAPIGPFIYKGFLQMAHDQHKPEVSEGVELRPIGF